MPPGRPGYWNPATRRHLFSHQPATTIRRTPHHLGEAWQPEVRNSSKIDAKTAGQTHTPREGDWLSPLLAHKEDNVLDVTVPNEKLCLLSNNGYEWLATRKICISLVPKYPKSVYLLQNIWIHWKRPYMLIWKRTDPKLQNATCGHPQHQVGGQHPVSGPKYLGILKVQRPSGNLGYPQATYCCSKLPWRFVC